MEFPIAQGEELPVFTTLALPEAIREELRRPLGPVLSEEQLGVHMEKASGPLATVGDMCTTTVHGLGHRIQLAVVDYQTQRSFDVQWKEATSSVGEVTVFISNAAGTITSDLYNTIILAWPSRTTTKIVVEGEEDLATLPVILHAPEGATVIYGIPDTGLCLVQVDEGTRGIVADALSRFEPLADRAPPRRAP